jgi:outer membrane protein
VLQRPPMRPPPHLPRPTPPGAEPSPRRSRPPLAVLALLGLAATAPARGAEDDAGTAPSAPGAAVPSLTLAEALAYAREHQPQILAARARVEAERAAAEVPRAQWLPSVGLTAQGFAATGNNTTASYLSLAAVDLPRIGGEPAASASTADLTPRASTLVAASITQEVFDFGRIAAQAAAADAQVLVRQRDADALRLDIEFGVEEAFFAVDAAKAVLTAAEDAFTRSRAHRDLARAGVQSGLRAPIELTRAEAELQRFDIERLRARGGVTVGQTVLAAAIGSPQPALDTRGPVAEASELPALAEALRRAEARDPHLASQLARLQAQAEHTTAVGAELRPDLFATGTLSGRAGGARSSGANADFMGLLPSVPNWDVGLVLSWPLFDGVVDARRNAAAAQERTRQAEIGVARQELAALVQRTFVNAGVARATLPGLERSVAAAVANEAQADARFRAGLGTSVELADAEALRVDAEIQLAIGRFEVARTRAAFGRAIAEGP